MAETAVTTTHGDGSHARPEALGRGGSARSCLVFFGVGTALATGADVVTTGLAFGLTVLVMAYSVGRVSGGHFNPAVTLGAAASGRLAWAQVPMYVGAQLAGAIVAAAVLWGIWQGVPGFSSEGSFGQNSFGDDGGIGFAWWAALLVEVVTTFIFLMVILAVTDKRNEHPALAPLAIGLSLAMIHFTTIPLTGTSVNPARSIGPALFAGSDAIIQLWLFILAPLLGGALAGLLYPCALRPPRRARRGLGAALRPSYAARGGPRLRRARRLPGAVEPAVRPGTSAAARTALAARSRPSSGSSRSTPRSRLLSVAHSSPRSSRLPSHPRPRRTSSRGPGTTTTTARRRFVRPPDGSIDHQSRAP